MQLAGLRIAYVLEATAGGTRKHVRELAFAAQRAGAQVLLAVSPGREPDYGDDIAAFREAGMQVALIPMRREISPLRDFACALRLWRVLSRFAPHLVHTHAAKAGALARSLAPLMRGTGFVHTPHTLPFEWAGQPHAAFYRLIEACLGRFTDAFVALTNSQKERLLAARVAKPGKVVTIPNGIGQVQAFARDFVRRRWQMSDEETLVVQVARLAPQKACGTFIEAANRLRDLKGLRCVLIGDGPMRQELEARRRTLGLADERFRFAGYLPRAWMYFTGADIVVLSSLYEGLPYVVLEAMSLGVPVIASDIAGIREIIESGRDGLLVPAGDAAALAAAIGRLAASAEMRRDLAAAGQRKVRCAYRHDVFIRSHLALYHNLAASLP